MNSKNNKKSSHHKQITRPRLQSIVDS